MRTVISVYEQYAACVMFDKILLSGDKQFVFLCLQIAETAAIVYTLLYILFHTRGAFSAILQSQKAASKYRFAGKYGKGGICAGNENDPPR